MGSADITGLLLAAGLGVRFGGNKLSAALNGLPLALHAAQTLAAHAGQLIAVCNPQNVDLNRAIADLGYAITLNDAPSLGLSRSLALGAAEAAGNGLLVCLADMPFVAPDHLAALLAAFAASKNKSIVATSCGDTRSPPAVFPRAVWPDLAVLVGDKGARDLLRTALSVEADPAILIDIDTQGDLTKNSAC
jgi:molybdenum cofactor cytidylyltransferase